jgi:hypothetical protein
MTKPKPKDAIGAARGAFNDRGKAVSTDELRRQARADEKLAEDRRQQLYSRSG